jgi:hypothetical protein
MSRLLAGSASLLATVATVVAVGHWPARASSATPFVSVPPLSAAAKKTLATYAGRIEQQTAIQPDGARTQTWTEPVSGRSRQMSRGVRGKIHFELLTTQHRTMEVDYDSRTWTSTNERFPFGVANDDGGPCGSPVPGLDRQRGGEAPRAGNDRWDSDSSLPAVPESFRRRASLS